MPLWRILERISPEIYILSRTEGDHVRYAPLCITRVPLMGGGSRESYEAIANVPDRLRWLRRSRGLIQKEAAEIAGVSRNVYVDLETGAAKRMPAQAADRLAAYYGVPATDLLDDYSRFLLRDPQTQLRQRRMESGLTREAFARQLGTSLINLERWETGKNTISYKCWERCFAERKKDNASSGHARYLTTDR